jgi:3-oxosteroid 1-dehydrogenase
MKVSMSNWDHSVDFLVIGSGAAGMTAALRAHDLGGETLIVEKADLFGGSSALSGGVIWVPANPLQAALGVRRQNISDKRARLLRDGSWFWPRPHGRPGTPFCDVAS